MHGNKLRMLSVVLAGTAASVASGQYAPGMSGRANEASNQVGSGGLNSRVQQWNPQTGNLIVTGNVTGGRRFRGFSPVRDSSSLFMSVPTGSLGTFVGDSVGIGDVRSTTSVPGTNPYFNPATTVSNAYGISLGLNQPGSSVPRTTYQIPTFMGLPSNPTTPAGIGARPMDLDVGSLRQDLLPPNSSIYTTSNLPSLSRYDRGLFQTGQLDVLRASPAYGRSVSTTTPFTSYSGVSTTQVVDPYALPQAGSSNRSTDPFVLRLRALGADPLAPSSETNLVDSQDAVSPTLIAPRLFQRQLVEPQRDPLTGRPVDTSSVTRATAFGRVPDYDATADDVIDPVAARDLPSHTAISLLPGSSMLVHYHSVEAEVDASNPLWSLAASVDRLVELQQDPGFVQKLNTVPDVKEQYEQVMASIHAAADQPIKTLAGDRLSRVNDYVRRAEGHVRAGDYYKATTVYRLAHEYDPGNALVQFGFGHALIAAGEYMTAVHHLTTAIDKYSAVAYVKFDLNSFVPDPTVLDVRRADLEARLQEREDYRLRFLLGYIEYHSGLEKFGIPNIRQAARQAPEDSTIARFPELLKRVEAVAPQAPGDSDQPNSDD